MTDTVLHLDRISKRFGALLANDAISFAVGRGEIVALLGENGAGKTTLMNILFGHYVADDGSISVFGKPLPAGQPHAAIAAGVGMVHQHFTLADNLTVLDNIMLGTEKLWRPAARKAQARQRLTRLAQDFGLAIEPDRTVAALSVGERQRVEILKALYREARILILDEPTAVLTPQESQSLFATLKKLTAQGLSIIFISHKLNEVLSVSDRILVLRAGKLVAERKTRETNRQELAELMVGRPIAEPKVEPQPCGEVHIEIRSVTTSDGLDQASLTLHGGEIMGLAGVSGNGQTALANLLSGLSRQASGSLHIFGQDAGNWTPDRMTIERIARIPEDRHAEGLIADMSVTENVIAELYRDPSLNRHGFLDWGKAHEFAKAIIKRFEVKCPSPQARVRLLSGGNMQKLILGRTLSLDPRFILACQPARGLDIGAVTYVHQRLLAARKAQASVLLISDDLDEILALADRIAVIYRGRISAPEPRKAVTIKELGLKMAGHGFGEGEAHAA
ncbi:ABC transporter ATP-binding protein [Taklimakanibacter lacteus]|uniref:ABC transporter ATP-binding protein n=1 Tax=Taklimakanibacter lacteus TaxID=2268456 RepID=UPI000E66E683